MSTHVFESAVIGAPIEKVWALLRPLDFKFLPDVKSTEFDGKCDPAEVGGVRTVTYKDGSVQKLKLSELSDARHLLSYELIQATPAVAVLSAVHSIRLYRVTDPGNSTVIELSSDFSSDASNEVLADSKYKKVDLLKALTAAATAKKKKRWLPLESNPKLMNTYLKSLGVVMSGVVEFQDVLGLEGEALDWVQSPQLAVLCTFPINEASEAHRKEEEKRLDPATAASASASASASTAASSADAKAAPAAGAGQVVSPNVYHLKQTVGNACGTVALIHAVANNQNVLVLEKGKFFDNFLKKTAKMNANQRAQALEDSPEIEVTHQATATHSDAKSSASSSFNDDLHFNAFVCVDKGLYELDGRKKFPIYHGPTTPNTLLRDAAKVIKQFMGRAKGDGRFAIIALAPPSPFSD